MMTVGKEVKKKRTKERKKKCTLTVAGLAREGVAEGDSLLGAPN